MHDIRWIRDNPEAFDDGLAARGVDRCARRLIELDETRRQAIAAREDIQARRNTASKQIGKAKGSGDEARASALMAEVASLKDELQALEDRSRALDLELTGALETLPNLPLDESVPVGPDEASNSQLSVWGEKPDIAAPLEHFDIGERIGGMDFETATRMSGSRFVILTNDLARLSRALGQFMLNLHTTEHGYTEVAPPLIVRDHAVYGTGQLPKAAEDMFSAGEDRWLIPTAEVPLTNMVRESILDPADLPLRFTALTPCFRSEAGASGRDTRGMLRQHQFDKVEMVSITTPEASKDELDRKVACAEEVLKRLGLHYRVMTLSTGDMSFAARKTLDVEVWLPGQGTFREISSCSLCGDFQARRMNARYRPEGSKGTEYVHTLNGSGVAVGRALIAVLENYQNADGTVTVPEALRPLMGGTERLG